MELRMQVLDPGTRPGHLWWRGSECDFKWTNDNFPTWGRKDTHLTAGLPLKT